MDGNEKVGMRRLGAKGPEVFPIALGCMGMSGIYGDSDENESIVTIHAALDRGINLIDTGDFYGMGHNEMLVGRALKGQRDKVLLSVKFGALRAPDGSWLGYDARPAAVKTALAYTLKRLGTDHIDVYRPARVDPNVPIEDTIGAIAELVEAGYVRHIGLSEAGPETIRRAAAVHPIVDLQIEYSLLSRGIEDDILSTCRELGIGITAYGVLSRGLISGHWLKDKSGAQDFRQMTPRFQGANLDANLALMEPLRAIAGDLSVSVAQVAIAWVAAQGNDIVPLVGARRRDRLSEALGASTFAGLETNLDYLRHVVRLPAFGAGGFSTQFLNTVNYRPKAIEVIDPGMQTTVQDHPGRLGYWDVGVPPSGPMDDLSFRLGNRALGNAEGAPGLECTASGPTLQMTHAATVCVTGAECLVTLDGSPVPMWEPIDVPAGGVLDVGTADTTGLRTYVLFAGGIDVPSYLGSASTFTLGRFGGHGGRLVNRIHRIPAQAEFRGHRDRRRYRGAYRAHDLAKARRIF